MSDGIKWAHEVGHPNPIPPNTWVTNVLDMPESATIEMATWDNDDYGTCQQALDCGGLYVVKDITFTKAEAIKTNIAMMIMAKASDGNHSMRVVYREVK